MVNASLTFVLVLVLALVASCGKDSVPPLTKTHHPAAAEKQATQTLVLMFPGVGDDGETYIDHGFVQRLQELRPGVDVVTVDAHRQYFAGRTLLARVDRDVLTPARRRGYAQIWIVGISMGGAGALLTARHFERDIEALVLFAPYLGRRRTIARIAAAGGLQKWKPPVGKTHWDVDLWRWIRNSRQGTPRTAIYLASGGDDIWAKAHQLLSEVLPPNHVFSAPGGHAWTVWSPLWTELLNAGVIDTGPVVAEGGRIRQVTSTEDSN